jgi:non-homologous end joining protein Ku
MKIIRAKMKGRKIEVDEPVEEDSSQIVDLMARLQESLDQGKRLKETRGTAKQSSADGDGAPTKRRKARAARKSA